MKVPMICYNPGCSTSTLVEPFNTNECSWICEACGYDNYHNSETEFYSSEPPHLADEPEPTIVPPFYPEPEATPVSIADPLGGSLHWLGYLLPVLVLLGGLVWLVVTQLWN